MADTTNTPPSSTEAAARLAAAQAAEASAVAALAGLEAAKAAAYEDIDREALAVLRPKITETEDDLGIARATVARAETELQTALAREEQDRRRTAYQAAEAKLAAVEEALRVRYPALASEIRGIVKQRAEADALVEEVNLNLPLGGDRLLPSYERSLTSHCQQDLEKENVELWVYDQDGTIVPDNLQAQCSLDRSIPGGKTGWLGNQRVTNRDARKIKYLPYDMSRRYDGLANRLCLPGLAGQLMIFEPSDNDGPRNVLSRIKGMEKREAEFKPRVRIPEYRYELLSIDTLADA